MRALPVIVTPLLVPLVLLDRVVLVVTVVRVDTQGLRDYR
jgi:hypothetical protein